MKRSMFLVVILAFGLMAVPAFADIWSIDIQQGDGLGGTITGDIATGFVGTNIAVDTMKILKNGVQIANLDLSGLGSVLPVDGNGAALVNFNTNLGTFTVNGGVTGLLAGNIDLVVGSPVAVVSAGSDVVALKFTQPDTKNLDMLGLLGIPIDTKWQLMYATFQTSGTGTVRNVSSVDIQNLSVPDGGVTLMLLGCALVGLETLRRKFRA
jgi:hypothetical protein